MKTYNQLIHSYQKQAQEKDISIDSIRYFLYELCSDKKINLYAEMDQEADREIADLFEKGMVRILNNEPINYVLGYCYFYGYRFLVDERTLIPRYETEELVSNILIECDEFFEDKKQIDAFDVGTGSGAIAIALKKEDQRMHLTASDISEQALEVAKANALSNDAKIEFLLGNMLDPYIEKGLKCDLLISNPPYIPDDEQIAASVRDFEPDVALFGGADGLKYYREIFEKAHLVLNKPGMMAFEIAYDKKEQLMSLLDEYFDDYDAKCLKDINNHDRMLIVKFHLV
jgi:release factor glutamine methyltransferase